MGLFIQQREERSQLQQKVAAELAERAKKRAEGNPERPDGISDSQFVKGTKQWSDRAWVWALLVLIGLGFLIWLLVTTIQ